MLDRIIDILKANKEISDWKILQNKVEANELFLIKKAIDMPRSKIINDISITVYVDYEAEEKKFRGSSMVIIHPTMTDDEISKAISEAAFSASFVRNQYYPLPEPTNSNVMPISTSFSTAPLPDWMPKIKEALYKPDNYTNGYINSAEIFLNKNNTTIINSRGIKHSYTNYKGQIELITSWKEKGEEIELYRELMFSDYDPEALEAAAQETLDMSREKADTQPTLNLESFTVILQGEPVAEVLKYYYVQSNAQCIYQKISTVKPEESVQGENIQGDKINMSIDPYMKNSVLSSPVDDDGFVLKAHQIVENGVLQKYWGNCQYSHYLNVKPTGRISNMVFEGGSKSIEEMRSIPHLEIAAFSDFLMNSTTGEFAGEIRLGWYFDGKTRTAISGGSISGNIHKLQENMYLSKEIHQCVTKELTQHIGYKGPKALLLHNVSVAGN